MILNNRKHSYYYFFLLSSSLSVKTHIPKFRSSNNFICLSLRLTLLANFNRLTSLLSSDFVEDLFLPPPGFIFLFCCSELAPLSAANVLLITADSFSKTTSLLRTLTKRKDTKPNEKFNCGTKKQANTSLAGYV